MLRPPVKATREIDFIAETLADFNMRYGELLSVLPVDEQTMREAEGPFWRNIRREAIAA